MKEFITFAKRNARILPYEKKHALIAYKAATEAIVLLKNDGILPLSIGKLALYGAGARKTIKGGSGSGEVNERYSVSIYEGLKQAGFEITTQRWLDDYDLEYEQLLSNTPKEIKNSIQKLDMELFMELFLRSQVYPYGRQITEADVVESDTDTCLYVVARQSGESADRKLHKHEFYFSDIEKSNLSFCATHYKHVIVALNIGSSFDVSFLYELPNIHAILYISQLGMAGGNAFADVLSGTVTPSGKLTDTWVKSYNDIPYGNQYSYLGTNLDDADYLEDIYVGYRYYDTFHISPRYPFGYGLSYTPFTIAYQKIQRNNQQISVTATVTNVGTMYSGKEVVQLYVSCPSNDSFKKEYQRLCAFAKTKELAPGEQTTVTLTFPLSYLTSYKESVHSSVLEQGQYIIRLGNHCRNTVSCAVIQLTETISYSKHKEICPLTKSLCFLEPISIETNPSDALFLRTGNFDCISLSSVDFTTIDFTNADSTPSVSHKQSRQKQWVEHKLRSLTTKEKVNLVTGAGILDMLMNYSYIRVPGVAGNTTSTLLHKGILNIAFADGPAGLRLQRCSTIPLHGFTKMVDTPFYMMQYFPSFFKHFIFGNPKKEPTYYQHTTAFPVENAMAQTWNVDLLEQMGKAIAKEMKEYGVTFWLAPALNIHRNPLCGRNYEYYSEDPVLSGKMAAAITKGVQKTKGCFVTLKHFAANNQEENRTGSSSNMTQRALREIYLKGFEIAITEGHAKGVMSSYNKINGIYTSNSKDLLTYVLRQEWHFKGLVMTDWTATAKGKSDPVQCMEAGNDLIMPGSSYDKSMILRGLKKKTLSIATLNNCVRNVLAAILVGQVDLN